MFRFHDDDIVLDDSSAAVIAADRLISGLISLLKLRGVTLRPHTEVVGISQRDNGVSVSLRDQPEAIADKVIVTAGPWTSRLLPSLSHTLAVAQQTVGYVRLRVPSLGHLPHFPVWIHLGRDFDSVHYGLPEFGSPGVKAAHHRTTSTDDDPDIAFDDNGASVRALETFTRERFAYQTQGLYRTERCLYTCTPDEEFIWSLSPDSDEIIIGAGHSGHGFKFAPLTGQVLGELALFGHTTIPDLPLPFSPTLAAV